MGDTSIFTYCTYGYLLKRVILGVLILTLPKWGAHFWGDHFGGDDVGVITCWWNNPVHTLGLLVDQYRYSL